MSTANLSLNITAVLATGKKDHTPPGMNLLSTVGQFTLVNLGSGDTTVNPPALTTKIVVIVPPTTATVTIRHAAGDTAIPLILSATDAEWFVLPVGTSFIVNASVAIAGIEVLYL